MLLRAPLKSQVICVIALTRGRDDVVDFNFFALAGRHLVIDAVVCTVYRKAI